MYIYTHIYNIYIYTYIYMFLSLSPLSCSLSYASSSLDSGETCRNTIPCFQTSHFALNWTLDAVL